MTGLPFGWWLVLLTLVYAALIGWGALAQARHALIISLQERARRAEDERDKRLVEVPEATNPPAASSRTAYRVVQED